MADENGLNYRIAYFTADHNYELVGSTLQGLKQYLEDHGGISLFVFDCFGISRHSTRAVPGYSIFDLPDLRDFDGVLIQGNQIIHDEVRDHIAELVAGAGIPAVSVDCPIAGCTTYGLDNRRAQLDITEHMIQEHQARRLVYLTGKLDNRSPSGPLRLEGFREACRKHGIPDSDTEVIPCEWKNSEGADVGKAWIASGRPLPDAFICANDEMAIGLMKELQAAGVRIPEDTAVVGIDLIPSADLTEPTLTTVDRCFGQLNYQAMELLIRMIGGEKAPERIDAPCRLRLAESCGCSGSSHLGHIRQQLFDRNSFFLEFNARQDVLSASLLRTGDLPELMRVFQDQSGLFSCDRVFLCVNDFYYDRQGASAAPNDYGREMVLMKKEAGAYRVERFATRGLLPAEDLAESRLLIFYPLQSDSGSIGYLATSGISEVTRLNLHQSLLSFLAITIENVQKKQLLNQLNEHLDYLYVHDEQTGLYNRFGLERQGRSLFRARMREGGAQILFVDVNGLKSINDRYGHEDGDLAIALAAKLISEASNAESFCMRYGGDEFMIIAPIADTGCAERIRAGAAQLNELPFPLTMSIGVDTAMPAADLPSDEELNEMLEACVRRADQKMYEAKAAFYRQKEHDRRSR